MKMTCMPGQDSLSEACPSPEPTPLSPLVYLSGQSRTHRSESCMKGTVVSGSGPRCDVGKFSG